MLRILILLVSLCLSLNGQAGLFDKKPTFLTSQQAFQFNAKQSGNQLALNWQIAEGYYLYQKEVEITPIQAELGEWQFPQAERYHDEFFGDVEIFRNKLTLQIPLKSAQNGSVEIRYQGCTKGFCYPPETVSVPLQNVEAQAVDSTQNIANSAVANSSQNSTASNMAGISQQDQLASQLSQNRLSIFWFFVLGIGLAFTPCVLPMLPLLSAIVIGNQQRPNSLKALLLSLTYVQGMALTYTLLGLIVAAIGLPFQIALQSPPVLIGLAILFTLLAASMFGLFEIRLPNAWQQKLNALSQKQSGGAFGGVFVMGMIAGLVASPCTSAPLSGALLYVAQSGDLFTGGLALYLLALGMGIPLVLITLFGNKILPKSGDWLLKVKTAFGFVMLALPIFLISRLVPNGIEPLLWSTLALVFLGWLISVLPAKGVLKNAIRIGLFALFALSAHPWANLVWSNDSQAIETTSHLKFTRISSLAELDTQLAEAKGKKVMFDLYADWCVACKEFEKYTFSDAKVQQKLGEIVVLQVDMTRNSAENDAIMQRFQILGLPTILFFDEQGQEISPMRVTGFLDSEQFLNWLNQ
ncbi:protein-disulfide reductase DsbD [Haemophilus paraphrohaemolyticus]|uniref:Thiol:disulfide interchange protein DsbD n=1 Tax=Haemophilus paraphrohaemolyticus TaxID=736 RepID=A0A369ZVR5_9PAST|nr:protein-disulfide reductase DsbD [Haemophilus paraphrohaemolyticus]RDF10894.1 protein-disulfide reductase DsbD [Haemophilus paraphrohaemolyticus]